MSPKKKVAAFFMYYRVRKEQLRAEENALTEDALADIVSSEWRSMTAEQRAEYKDQADRENGKIRQKRHCSALWTSSQPETGTPVQKMSALVSRFLAVEVGAPRTDVMRFEFVSCCISPIFVRRRQYDLTRSTQNWSPVEICLARWNITFGIKEVYHVVYGVSDIPQGATVIPTVPGNFPDCDRICFDLDVIAAEVREFIGSTNGVLSRGIYRKHVSACLNHLLNHNSSVVRATPMVLDNVIVLQQLLINERRNRVQQSIPFQDLWRKFDAATTSGAAKFDRQLRYNTAVDCWHTNQQFCAARRAVNDVFVLLGELGPTFQARMLAGQHMAIPGEILPRKSHCCAKLAPSQCMDAFETAHEDTQRMSAEGEFEEDADPPFELGEVKPAWGLTQESAEDEIIKSGGSTFHEARACHRVTPEMNVLVLDGNPHPPCSSSPPKDGLEGQMLYTDPYAMPELESQQQNSCASPPVVEFGDKLTLQAPDRMATSYDPMNALLDQSMEAAATIDLGTTARSGSDQPIAIPPASTSADVEQLNISIRKPLQNDPPGEQADLPDIHQANVSLTVNASYQGPSDPITVLANRIVESKNANIPLMAVASVRAPRGRVIRSYQKICISELAY